jgi:hypothetical protein
MYFPRELAMGYQQGFIGPIDYHQDNSGNRTDTDTPFSFTPEQFGAPPGSQFITGLVQQQVSVLRGRAYVHNLTITSHAISFNVFTQAASDSWIFGWHSGSIVVSTSFTWYCITDRAIKGGERFFTEEVPAAAARPAPAWLPGRNPVSTNAAAVESGATTGLLGTAHTATGALGPRTQARGAGGGCGCGR